MISSCFYWLGVIWLTLAKRQKVVNDKFKITLSAHTKGELEAVNLWCQQLWPGECGTVWDSGWPLPTTFFRAGGITAWGCSWWLTRREDHAMFLLTWAHLVEPPRNYTRYPESE
jgi:hypothetical protein